MEARKLDFIDRMRGLAILMVIAVHYVQMFATPAIRKIGFSGEVGVQLFFVASAFTLCRSADQRRDERHPVRNFYIRRYFRIAPLYYLAIAGYAALYLWAGKGGNYTPGNILANVLFVHGVVPSAQNTVVPGGWSIGAEMLFYVMFPWLYRTVEAAWLRWGNRALVLALALALAIALAWQAGYRLHTGRWVGNADFAYCLILNQLPVFMLGIAYYLAVWRGGAFAPHALRDWAGFVVLFGICAAIIALRIGPMFGPLSTIAALASLFLANVLRAQDKAGGWLVAVGKVSYSLYVLHFAVVWQPSAWVVHAVGGLVQAEWALMVPLYVVDVALLYAIARLTLRWIENPANTLARRIIARFETP